MSNRRQNIGVLELSSRAVKALVGHNHLLNENQFNFEAFKTKSIPTHTAGLIKEDENIDLELFTAKVIPAILDMKQFFYEQNADQIYKFGTAAYRMALNKKEVQDLIFEKTRYHVDILTSKQEGNYFFKGFLASKSPHIDVENKNLVLVDIGGASCEIIFAHGNALIDVVGMEIGSEILKDYLFGLDTDIITGFQYVDIFLSKHLNKYFHSFNTYKAQLGILAGRAVKIIANTYVIEKLDKCKPTPKSIIHLMGKFEQNIISWCKNLDELKKTTEADENIEGLLSTRLIMPIYLKIMEQFNLNSTRIAISGVSHGVFWETYMRRVKYL